MQQPHVLLFGDVVVDTLPALRKLYTTARSRPLLARFLERATHAIKTEYQNTPADERPKHSDFVHLLELGERHAAQPDVIAATSILAVAQLGEFLILAEDDPSVLNNGYNNVYQLGVCQGALPGAVAAAARDSSEIVSLGVEVLKIVFRLGVHLVRRSKAVEDSDGSWVIAVLGLNPSELQHRLNGFNEGVPISRHAYIGISTKTWSSVFAPPSTLKRLQTHIAFTNTPRSALPNGVAAHAPHLPPLDSEAILGDSTLLTTPLPRQSAMSLGTAAPFTVDTLGDLLRGVIGEMAGKQQLLDEGLAALGDQLDDSSAVSLSPVGPTPHETMVQARLREKVATVEMRSRKQHGGDASAAGDLAIVGMSGRFPQSDSLDEFWDLLLRGVDTCEEIPSSRFPIDDFYDPDAEGDYTTSTRYGCFLREPGKWDHAFFNISPKEAVQMDPLHRLLLTATYEALQMSGYSGGADAARVATFIGQTTQDWWTVNDQHGPNTHYMPSVVRAFTPGKLNHFFHFGSGYSSVDTACTSSFTALDQARKALLARDCDVAVVGGGSLCALPEPFCGLSKGGFLSPTGQCKTFQDAADGYCRGEAVGVVVVKRLEDAQRDHDNIIGVVNGITRSTNAGDVSITHPKESAQVALYQQLLRQTGIDPHDVGFVEMHGTGTIAGDTTELSSVRQIFARNRAADNPLHVGALKANFGHSEAAAGIVSLIKSLLILREGQIPPQPHYPFKINRRFPDLNALNLRIADGSPLRPWSKGDGRKKIVVNGFDAAGGNASVLISEAPAIRKLESDSRKHHVVACSGKSPTSLAANKAALVDHLRATTTSPLQEIAFTTTARRMHESYRQAFSVSSVDDLVQRLEQPSNDTTASSTKPRRKRPSLVFAFSGQSSQYTGMASTLYTTCASFRRTIDRCASICLQYDLASFIDLISGSQDVTGAAAAQLQLAIIAVEIALARHWISLGLKPDLVIGHSLGEYAALHISGVLSLTDTLLLTNERAKIVEKRCSPSSHAMLAVSTDERTLRQVAPDAEISCINGPSATVASGTKAQIEDAKSRCAQKGIRAITLQGQYGFHSSQMDAALTDFRESAERSHYCAPQIPVASTLLGEVILEEDTFNADYLVRHMRNPVNFLQAVRSAESESFFRGDTAIVEIGPHPMCLAMTSASLSSQPQSLSSLPSLTRGKDDWSCVSDALATLWTAGFDIDWKQFHSDFKNELQLVRLPSYAWQETNHWIPYEARNGMVRKALESAQVERAPSKPQETIGVLRVESVDKAASGNIAAQFCCPTSTPQLHEAIAGHVVTGIALCPASVFIDMALSAVKFLFEQNGEDTHVKDFEIFGLEMKHPLILASGPDPTQTVYTTAKLESPSAKARVTFTVREGPDSPSKDLGSVELLRATTETDTMWPRLRPMVSNRTSELAKASRNDTAHRILRPVVYRLFGAVVQYSAPYQAISEVRMTDVGADALAYLSLSAAQVESTVFTCTPYLSDALVHLAGFVLNGMIVDPNETLYIANKVDSIRILGTASEGMKLTCYCCFRDDGDDRVKTCDLYVYGEDGLFAVSSGVRFTKMSRAFFATLTGNSNTQPSKAAQKKPLSPSEREDRDQQEDVPKPAPNKHADQPQSSLAAPRPSPQANKGTMSAFLDVTSEQTGLAKEDIEEWTDFASIGVDSQMAISIAAEMRKKTGVELDAAFFITFSTIAEAREELDGPDAAPDQQGEMRSRAHSSSTMQEPPAIKAHNDASATQNRPPVHSPSAEGIVASSSTSQSESPPTLTPPEHDTQDDRTHPEERDCEPLLLHGDPNSTLSPVFLIADESGEATPYLHFPSLPDRRRLYAVESPFVDNVKDLPYTIEELVGQMKDSIRRMQPRGPYFLGGCSVGSVLTYEVAKQFASEGEKVGGLVLLDPSRSLTGTETDDALKSHAAKLGKAVEAYQPIGFADGSQPQHACLVWSGTERTHDEQEDWRRVLQSSNLHSFTLGECNRENMLSLNSMRGEAGSIILKAIENCVGVSK